MLVGVVAPERRAARISYQPLGTAVYRREVRAEVGDGSAVGEVIDDFHHFRALVRHDGERVTGVEGETLRHPWVTCAEATEPLQRLVGTLLEKSLRGPGQHTAVRAQCTHLFDAACLAIARVGRRAGSVVYSVAIPDRQQGRTRVEISRDGQPLYSWELDWMEIVSPDPFSGRGIRAGLAAWAEAELGAESAEAVMVLQRACIISMGRFVDLEGMARADAVEHGPMGQCHTYTPGIVERGFRVVGSVRNFTREKQLRAASLRTPGRLQSC